MWKQILSITSIFLGLYIVYFTFTTYFNSYYSLQTQQYHTGCYNDDNSLNHSVRIKQFVNKVQSENQMYQIQKKSFTLMNKVNFNQVSKEVARDFQMFLNQYYQIKMKSVYEQNYYNSLGIAEEKYQECKNNVVNNFNQDQCQNTYQIYLDSNHQYQTLKKTLYSKIQRKQQQQRKISYLILDTNYSDVQEYQLNLTNQITTLNQDLQVANNKKIDLLTRRATFEDTLKEDKTKLSSSRSLLDQCEKNIKIINFCNQLNQQLKSIKITFTKQDIQKKIQRKQMIIDTHLNAIRNAEKLQDYELLQFNRKNLAQNQQELKLLQLSLQDFKTFQQSYCSQCSQLKIKQLREQVKQLTKTTKQIEIKLNKVIQEQKIVANDILTFTTKISQLQEQRDFNINSKICLSEQCQSKRSQDLAEYGRTLNEMKKDVLDHKFELQQHGLDHKKRVKRLNQWIFSVNQVIKCLNQKKYYQQLRENRPKQNQNQVMKIQLIKKRLIEKLENLSQQ